MRIWSFSIRTAKEVLRDPITLIFGLCFPVVLLLLLTAIQANIPAEVFAINSLTPGIVVFGQTFLSLFTATLVAKDRESALLQRLYTTPMRAGEFICGYILPMLPLAVVQCAVCYLVGLCLGLSFSVHLFSSMLFLLPVALLFIGVGLIFGSILSVKGASGVCGGLFTNLSAWLSGVWFDLSLVGGAFEKIAELLPFLHAVEMSRAVCAGDYAGIFPHLYWVLGYVVLVVGLAIFFFLRQMKKR